MTYAVMRKSDNTVVNEYSLPFVLGSDHIVTATQYQPTDITFGSDVELIQSADVISVGTPVSNPVVVVTATPAVSVGAVALPLK